MPQLISQPSTSVIPFHPVGNLDALVYKLKSLGAEFQTSAGQNPSVTIEYDGDVQTAGQQFIIFGQTYTVATGSSTATTVNLTSGTALQQAERVRDAILANVNLYPYVQFSITQSGSNYRLTLTWQKRVGFTDVYTNGTLGNPYTIVSEVLGAPAAYVAGFRLAYQFFTENDTGGTAVTDLRSVPPLVVNDIEQNIEIDFVDIAAGLVSTTRPFSLSGIPTTDDTISKRVFLRYGSHTTVDGVTTWGSFQKSGVAKILNAAVRLDSVKLSSYYYRGIGILTKFLTYRPTNWTVNKEGQYEWLWFIGSIAQNFAILGTHTLTNYKIRYTTYSTSGGATITTNDLSTSDGVFIIPCGPSNLPSTISLADKVRYTVQIFANIFQSGVPAFIEVSELMTFYLNDGFECTEPFTEIYFLEPLGGFGTLPIHSVTVEAEQEYLTHELPLDPDAQIADRRISFGHSVNSAKSWYRLNMQVRLRYSKENFEYLTALRSSPEHHVRYKPNDTVNEVWKFVPDTGSMQVYQKDDYAIADISGRIHAELPVQKQPLNVR